MFKMSTMTENMTLNFQYNSHTVGALQNKTELKTRKYDYNTSHGLMLWRQGIKQKTKYLPSYEVKRLLYKTIILLVRRLEALYSARFKENPVTLQEVRTQFPLISYLSYIKFL